MFTSSVFLSFFTVTYFYLQFLTALPICFRHSGSMCSLTSGAAENLCKRQCGRKHGKIVFPLICQFPVHRFDGGLCQKQAETGIVFRRGARNKRFKDIFIRHNARAIVHDFDPAHTFLLYCAYG